MAVKSLAEFLATAGEKPYRELIEYHMRRQSRDEITKGLLGEVELLPANLRPHVEEFIDVVNGHLGYDQEFWRSASCNDAAEKIAVAVAKAMPSSDVVGAFTETLRSVRSDLSLSLFQIATLNFAYSVHSERKQRKFMGIRKGLFG